MRERERERERGGEMAELERLYDEIYDVGLFVKEFRYNKKKSGAAVGTQEELAPALGLDIESASGLDPELIAVVCRPEEARRVCSAGASGGLEALRIFSAKEAVYKALWPTLRRFLDFQALAVAWDDADGSFRATAHDPGCPAPLAEAIRGRCLRQAGMLVTAAWISAGDWRPGPGPAPA